MLEDWAENLSENAQDAFDTFWNQIWDIIDEFRDYGYKVPVSLRAEPYVEKFLVIISDDDISQKSMTKALNSIGHGASRSVKRELMVFVKRIFDHVKSKILELLLPELAEFYRDKELF